MQDIDDDGEAAARAAFEGAKSGDPSHSPPDKKTVRFGAPTVLGKERPSKSKSKGKGGKQQQQAAANTSTIAADDATAAAPITYGLGLLLVISFAFYVLVFNYLSNLPASSEFYLQVQQRFWPQAHLYISVWYALGLQHMIKALAAYGQQPPPFSSSSRSSSSSVLLTLGLPAAATLLISYHYSSHYELSDLSKTYIFREFGKQVLSTLPSAKDKKRVVLFTLGDEVLNSVRYAQRQLGIRKDVTLLDMNYMQFDWFIHRAKAQAKSWGLKGFKFPGTHYGSAEGAFVMADLLEANYEGTMFFVCGGMHANDPSWQQSYRLWPLGMNMQLLRKSTQIRLDKWSSKSERSLPKLTWPSPPRKGSWTEVIANNHYLAAYHQRPYYVLNYAYEASQLAEHLEKELQRKSGGGGGGGGLHAGMPVEQIQAAQRQVEAQRREARERFHLAGALYEHGDGIALNGSRTLPNYYYRNWGVAYSQFLGVASSPEEAAGAKQRATKAFLKYLAFSDVTGDDRVTVEHGVLSLLPPPERAQRIEREREGGVRLGSAAQAEINYLREAEAKQRNAEWAAKMKRVEKEKAEAGRGGGGGGAAASAARGGAKKKKRATV